MINRLPRWFKQDFPSELALGRLRRLNESGINTVCKVAQCPNLGACFHNQQMTFMILGDSCTRNCRFCAVRKSSADLLPFDPDEPERIASQVKRLGLSYVVITSVTRDDLEDGGAGIFAQTMELIHALSPDIKVEVLIPDFKGDLSSLKYVLDSAPEVVGHNIETVPRLYSRIRPKADYALSLRVLSAVKEQVPFLISKSSLMLGMGETEEQVKSTMQDLRRVDCDILTLGQYLSPSKEHYPVYEFIAPAKFREYRQIALDLGFRAVLSGPLVRSSYQAEKIYNECLVHSS